MNILKIKRLLLMLTLLIGAASAASAADKFSVNALSIAPGQTADLEFTLSNLTPFYGFQLDIALPSGLEFVKNSDNKADITLSSTRLGSYQLVSNLTSANSLKLGAFSPTHTPISENSGVLFTAKVKAAATFSSGSVSVTEIRFTNEQDKDVKLDDASATVTSEIKVSSITLQATKNCKVGENFTLSPTIAPENATNKTVTWTSSDKTVATVDVNGNVTPHKVGTTNITVTAQDGSGVSATCAVTVVPTPAESVTLNQTTASLKVSETVQLTATVSPTTTTNKTVTWTSDKPGIAKVENGLVTAVSPGEATITATCGSVYTTCKVTVTKIAVSTVTLSKTALTLSPGSKEKLTAAVTPDNATYKAVTWTSSDVAVATVADDGTVTAVKAGNATITATADGVSATASVKVMKAPENLTAILANPSIKQGETTTLTISLSTAENFSYKGLQFNVTLPDGVTVESSTFNSALPATCVKAFNTSNNSAAVIITAVGEEIKTLSEILTITLKAAETTDVESKNINISGIKLSSALGDNNLPDVSSTLNIIKREIPVTGITLSSSAVSILKGNEATITATVTPADATNQELEWSVDDSSIISLSANGKSATVTGLDLGEATVTVRAKDGSGVSATATVKVNPVPAESITLAGTDVTSLKVGQTNQLTATVSPDDTTYPEIEWSSSDIKKATVSASGLVTAVALGDVTITAKVKATPTVTATYKLTVVPTPATSITLSGTEVTTLKERDWNQLTAKVSPDETTYPEIVWSSSNEKVATVSENGLVTAIATGNAKITATVKATPTVSAVYSLTVEPLLLGDSNEDGKVDVFDVVNVAKHIAGKDPKPFCFVASDVIWDGEINPADLNGVSNLAIGLPVDHQPSRAASRGPVANGGRFIAGEPRLNAEGNVVIPVAMTSDAKLSSLQANVILPEGMDVISVKTTAAAADHSLIYNVTDDGVLRIVLFSFDNTLLAADSKALIEIAVDANGREGEMLFDNVLAATPGCALYRLEAEPYHFNTPTSVDDLTGDSLTVRPTVDGVEILNAAGLEVTVLDIQGRVIKQFATATDRELCKLASGFYIVKVGNDAFKVNVK